MKIYKTMDYDYIKNVLKSRCGGKSIIHAVIATAALTFTILWANFKNDTLMTVFLFLLKVGFDMLCKLSPLEIICMKR